MDRLERRGEWLLLRAAWFRRKPEPGAWSQPASLGQRGPAWKLVQVPEPGWRALPPGQEREPGWKPRVWLELWGPGPEQAKWQVCPPLSVRELAQPCPPGRLETSLWLARWPFRQLFLQRPGPWRQRRLCGSCLSAPCFPEP